MKAILLFAVVILGAAAASRADTIYLYPTNSLANPLGPTVIVQPQVVPDYNRMQMRNDISRLGDAIDAAVRQVHEQREAARYRALMEEQLEIQRQALALERAKFEASQGHRRKHHKVDAP